MVSQKSHASSKETFGKQKEENTGYDLPKDLEPWQRFAFECTWYRNSSDTSSSSWLSSDSEDLDVITSLFTALESERKDATPALDTSNPTPIDVAAIPDDEAIESPKKVAPVVPVNTTESTGFETKQLSHKLSAEEPLEAQSDSHESCRKRKFKNPVSLPLRRSNRLLKKDPNTSVKPRPKRKAKASMEAVPNCRRSKRIRDSKLSSKH